MRFIILIICVSLISCFGKNTNSNDTEMDSINKQFHAALKKINPEENPTQYKAYVIIPNSGCSGCINDAEEMLKSSIKKSNDIKYVLTNIESLKMISNKMGFDVTKNKMIIIDKQNLFNAGPLISIYPKTLMIRKEDGYVYKKLEVSPEQNGLEILKKEYLIK
jgi:hypothetical protein